MTKTWKLLAMTLLLCVAPVLTVNAQGPPVCSVFCVTTPCSSQADCPDGRCNFACPGVGCCVDR